MNNFPELHVERVSQLLGSADASSHGTICPKIMESWRRSFSRYHLDPASHDGPRILEANQISVLQERSRDFISVASEEMSRLVERIAVADYGVLLTDAEGCTLSIQANMLVRPDLRRAGVELGTCWSEGQEGTCGIALAAALGEAVSIHKREHFRAAFINLSCSAAPIFGPDGRLLGVLNATSLQAPDDARSQHLTLQLVKQSARDIENAFFMHSTRGLSLLRAHASALYIDSRPDYLFGWDSDGQIQALNSGARFYLMQRYGFVPTSVYEVFKPDELRASTDGLTSYSASHNLHMRTSIVASTSISVPSLILDNDDETIARNLQLGVRVKNRHLPILIQGETGAGKEHFAHQLHNCSSRSNKPFVAINCAAIPESLIESELFGYAPGAFTGAATKGKNGLIHQAEGGTLFLDEIGDMPLIMQSRLLRVLNDGEVVPLGSTQSRRIDLHLICASHKDLRQMVAEGQFREDLYYRLNGVKFEVPPLRQRNDKATLIERLLAEEAGVHSFLPRIEEPAMQLLLTYKWPGNIRQLRFVLRYAFAVHVDSVIRLGDLPPELYESQLAPTLELRNDRSTRQIMIDALVLHRWKPDLAAKELGISRATLYRWVNKFGIVMPRKYSP